jgi:hypothetical protein
MLARLIAGTKELVRHGYESVSTPISVKIKLPWEYQGRPPNYLPPIVVNGVILRRTIFDNCITLSNGEKETIDRVIRETIFDSGVRPYVFEIEDSLQSRCDDGEVRVNRDQNDGNYFITVIWAGRLGGRILGNVDRLLRVQQSIYTPDQLRAARIRVIPDLEAHARAELEEAERQHQQNEAIGAELAAAAAEGRDLLAEQLAAALAAGGAAANPYANAPHIGELEIPNTAEDPIGYRNLAALRTEGTEMVNFQGELGHNRIYTRANFNALRASPSATPEGLIRNPTTSAVVQPANVRYYRVRGPNVTGGRSRKMRKSRGRRTRRKV